MSESGPFVPIPTALRRRPKSAVPSNCGPAQRARSRSLMGRTVLAVAQPPFSELATVPKVIGIDNQQLGNTMKLYSGGCSCGAVRFAIERFLYVLACHCDACKKAHG